MLGRRRSFFIRATTTERCLRKRRAPVSPTAAPPANDLWRSARCSPDSCCPLLRKDAWLPGGGVVGSRESVVRGTPLPPPPPGRGGAAARCGATQLPRPQWTLSFSCRPWHFGAVADAAWKRLQTHHQHATTCRQPESGLDVDAKVHQRTKTAGGGCSGHQWSLRV